MANSQIRALIDSFRSESLAGTLSRAATGSLGMQVTLTAVSLVTNILLARWLGAAEYGLYSYAITWLAMLSLPSQLGFDRLLVREVAAYQAQEKWEPLKGILRFAFLLVLPVSLMVLTIVLGAARIIPNAPTIAVFVVLAFTMLQLPFNALTGLSGSALRGFNRIVRGQVPNSLVNPVLFLVFIAAAVFLFDAAPSAQLTAQMALGRTVVAFVIAVVMLLKAIPDPVKAAKPAYDTRLWLAAAVPMLLTNTLSSTTGRIDVLILGSLAGTEAVGIYNVVFRGVQLITFGLVAINLAIGPTVAKLYASGEINRLQTLMTRSARMILLYTVPVSTGFILFGSWFLALFGPDFVSGYQALVILSIGRIFSAAVGSAGLLLTMTGHEKTVFVNLVFGIFVNVALDWLLIPRFGINGAAAAASLSLIARNIYVAIRAHQLLGIHTTALGKFGRFA